jgi:hypothetical protein
MAIFNSYVKLPEGNHFPIENCHTHWGLYRYMPFSDTDSLLARFAAERPSRWSGRLRMPEVWADRSWFCSASWHQLTPLVMASGNMMKYELWNSWHVKQQIWCDMIWYVMLCYGMLWYVMVCYVMVCYGMYACMHVCMYACMYVCMYEYTIIVYYRHIYICPYNPFVLVLTIWGCPFCHGYPRNQSWMTRTLRSPCRCTMRHGAPVTWRNHLWLRVSRARVWPIAILLTRYTHIYVYIFIIMYNIYILYKKKNIW